MNIRISNWALESKVEEAIKEAGFINGGLYENETEQFLIELLQFFVVKKSFDFKVVIKNRKNEEGETVKEHIVVIDSKAFMKRNPAAHVKLGEKKKRIPQKEYGTKRYPVEDVLSKVDKRSGMRPRRELFDGDEIKMNSLRLRTFKEKGCKCVSCGLEGTYFLKFRSNPLEHWHFNLYGEREIVENGEKIVEQVLFTKDHILPKSKGGPDSIENMQTMCCQCNHKKGNTTD